MPVALVIAPFHDRATEITSECARIAVEILEENGFHVYTLEKDDATRDKLEEFLRKHPETRLIIYMGHGDEDKLLGQLPQGEVNPLIDLTNVDLLAGKVVVAVACLSGRRLGMSAIAHDAKAYLGWDDLVYIALPVEGVRNYQADFMRALLAPVITVAKHRTFSEAKRNFEEVCDYYINLYEQNKWKFWDVFKRFMEHNKNHFVIHGEEYGSL